MTDETPLTLGAKIRYVIIDDLAGSCEPGLYDAEISKVRLLADGSLDVEIRHTRIHEDPYPYLKGSEFLIDTTIHVPINPNPEEPERPPKSWQLEQAAKSHGKPPKKGKRR